MSGTRSLFLGGKFASEELVLNLPFLNDLMVLTHVSDVE